jgi:hypothetical protein
VGGRETGSALIGSARPTVVAAVILAMLVIPTLFQALGVHEVASKDTLPSGDHAMALVVDPRPDLSIASSDIYFLEDGLNISGSTYGREVYVHAIARNLGAGNASDFDVLIGIRNISAGYNHTLYVTTASLASDSYENHLDVSFSWNITLLVWGSYEFWVYLDSSQSIDESNETNNWMVKDFELQSPMLDVIVFLEKTDLKPGEVVLVTAVVYYSGTPDPVPNLPGVTFVLVNSDTGAVVPGSETSAESSTPTGEVVSFLTIPSNLTAGKYALSMVFASMQYPCIYSDEITVGSQRSLTSVYVLIVATVVAIAAVMIVVIYVLTRREDA